jgi:hypothetical protein
MGDIEKIAREVMKSKPGGKQCTANLPYVGNVTIPFYGRGIMRRKSAIAVVRTTVVALPTAMYGIATAVTWPNSRMRRCSKL